MTSKRYTVRDDTEYQQQQDARYAAEDALRERIRIANAAEDRAKGRDRRRRESSTAPECPRCFQPMRAVREQRKDGSWAAQCYPCALAGWDAGRTLPWCKDCGVAVRASAPTVCPLCGKTVGK